ncbi:energy transducer TonB [Pseudomonas sp. WS 5051]|uniref:energy transducer TonB family protein n=1 Tax=Pseudomonas sp. WS 5051 TaxID=2717482 RepID=UPI001473F6EA|nr:energy transducer TonB [Pseudomonas sp. WS 5051]NMY54102.1 energy transducer TonB [Pseudomonas sp. WS 5051]
MSVFFKSRKAIACLPAICLLAVAVHSSMDTDLKITPKYDDSSVEVALIDLDELLPPPPEPEPEPEQVAELPPPEEEVVEAVEIAPPPPPKPKPPAPRPPPPKPKPQVVKAVPTPPRPQPQPVLQAPTPAPATAPHVAPARPIAQAPRANPADLESRYIARLLAELEKYKQYPRGREASLQRPQGNVVVWLLVDRSGKVLDSGIEKKATNMLLNRAAQTSLQRLDKVVPFPEESFSGKDKYRFSATLVYNTEP